MEQKFWWQVVFIPVSETRLCDHLPAPISNVKKVNYTIRTSEHKMIDSLDLCLWMYQVICPLDALYHNTLNTLWKWDPHPAGLVPWLISHMHMFAISIVSMAASQKVMSDYADFGTYTEHGARKCHNGLSSTMNENDSWHLSS